MDYKKYANLFKVLSDETRLQIVQMLMREKMCACEIQEKFKITQPTLSHHMKSLCDSNLLICEKVGKWNHYSINETTFTNFLEFMHTLHHNHISKGEKQ